MAFFIFIFFFLRERAKVFTHELVMHPKLESTMHVFKHSNLSSCDVLNELNKKKILTSKILLLEPFSLDGTSVSLKWGEDRFDPWGHKKFYVHDRVNFNFLFHI